MILNDCINQNNTAWSDYELTLLPMCVDICSRVFIVRQSSTVQVVQHETSVCSSQFHVGHSLNMIILLTRIILLGQTIYHPTLLTPKVCSYQFKSHLYGTHASSSTRNVPQYSVQSTECRLQYKDYTSHTVFNAQNLPNKFTVSSRLSPHKALVYLLA